MNVNGAAFEGVFTHEEFEQFIANDFKKAHIGHAHTAYSTNV